jgi:UDP-N-acetylglucosamine 2-epimerase
MLKVLSVFGTRPEAIKMAPVILAMRQQAALFEVKVCGTAASGLLIAHSNCLRSRPITIRHHV